MGRRSPPSLPFGSLSPSRIELELEYLESPGYQRFAGFRPDDGTRRKSLRAELDRRCLWIHRRRDRPIVRVSLAARPQRLPVPGRPDVPVRRAHDLLWSSGGGRGWRARGRPRNLIPAWTRRPLVVRRFPIVGVLLSGPSAATGVTAILWSVRIGGGQRDPHCSGNFGPRERRDCDGLYPNTQSRRSRDGQNA